MARKFWTNHEQETLRTKYGKVDIHELAAAMGRTVSSLHNRAGELGITFDRRAELGPDFETFIREKKSAGWNDQEIADAWGCNIGTVVKWRNRIGVPTNHGAPLHHARLKAAHRRHCVNNGVKNLVDFRYLRRRIQAAKVGSAA